MLSKMLAGALNPLADWSWLVLRVVAGLSLTAHGATKMVGVEGTAYMFQLPWENAGFVSFVGEGGLGFPMPVLFATAAVLTEFFGGLLLALGLHTRIACVFNVFLMAVITFGVHLEKGFWAREGGIEYPLLWLLVFLVFLTSGAGRYSMDAKAGRE